MTITVKKLALTEQEPQPHGELISTNYLGLLNHIEVRCTARIGTFNLSIAALKQLKTGQLLPLEQKTSDLVEILLNDQVIARGELMSHEDQYAIQITEIAS